MKITEIQQFHRKSQKPINFEYIAEYMQISINYCKRCEKKYIRDHALKNKMSCLHHGFKNQKFQ